jgi:CheY-like chemotaxis protein
MRQPQNGRGIRAKLPRKTQGVSAHIHEVCGNAEERRFEMDAVKIKRLCILVVENRSDAGVSIETLIAPEGHRTITAKKLVQAVAIARAVRFDVLLIDIRMCARDGISLIAELKSLYPIRSIALADELRPGDVKRAAELGFDDFIFKPVHMDDLRIALGGLAPRGKIDRDSEPQARHVTLERVIV